MALPRFGGPARAAAAIAALAVLVVSCHHTFAPIPDLSSLSAEDPAVLVARGEYIVRDVAVCGHCHAAEPTLDVDGPLSGGMEFEDWRIGTARASNLTPDSATGLGRWSDADIVRALRNGQSKDGRLLAPVMPYAWFHGMSDRDALAVARYLRTLPPTRHAVSQSPGFWLKLGKLLFLGPKDPVTSIAPRRAATAEYGRYLANDVGLCADCHTPRGGIRSSPDKDRLFAGTADPPDGFPANPTNLTPDSATGIGRWSEEDFLRTLRTGVDPQGDSLHAFMPWRQIRRMSDDDLRAIHRYFRTLQPIRNEVPRREPESGPS